MIRFGDIVVASHDKTTPYGQTLTAGRRYQVTQIQDAFEMTVKPFVQNENDFLVVLNDLGYEEAFYQHRFKRFKLKTHMPQWF